MNTHSESLLALSPAETAKKVEDVAVEKINRNKLSTFMLAVTAGIFIGIAFVFYVVATSGAHGMLPYGLTKLIGGLCFSLGLMLVVILGGELFTSTVLTITARASKRISTKQLLGNWALVYFGNFVGAMILVALMITAKHYMSGHGVFGLGYMTTAQAKLHHTFSQAFALGIMCNILVCLAVWMSYAARTVTDKLLAVVLPVAMFVAAGFEHCIANMFLIPMAIVTKNVAGPEFWTSIGANPSQFADLNWQQFIFHNLVPVTLGNIVGGAIFIGLTYWFVFRRPSLNRG